MAAQPFEKRHLPRIARHDPHGRGLRLAGNVLQVLLHRPDDVLRAVELLRLDVAGMPAQHRLALAHVVARKPDAELLTRGHHALARTVERAGVGREADVLLLHGRVDVHPLEVLLPCDFVPERRGQGLHDHLLRARLPGTAAPAAHRRLVCRRPVLEELPAAKVLPVRVLAPVVQHVLVAHREHVLQERQPRHHPDRNGRTTFVAAVGGFKRLLEPFPVYCVRQKDEFVILRDEVAEHDSEQVVLHGPRAVGFCHHFRGQPLRFP